MRLSGKSSLIPSLDLMPIDVPERTRPRLAAVVPTLWHGQLRILFGLHI